MRSFWRLAALLLCTASPAAAAWRAEGVKLLPGPGRYDDVQLAPDGAGGVYALCSTARYYEIPGAGYSYTLQRVRADGTLASGWSLAGVPVDTATGAIYSRLVPDGTGGALVAWRTLRTGQSAIFTQHVLADGSLAPGWPEGGAVTVAQYVGNAIPGIVPDAAGGAFVSWQDFRNGYSYLQDPYIQHLGADAAPAPGWSANGEPLTEANQDQFDPVLTTDGSGGAIAAWWDYRDSTVTNYDVYALRLNADGSVAPGWTAGGTPVCRAPYGQFSPAICSDGAGGALIAWTDYRNPVAVSVYAQRLLTNGVVGSGWLANGVRVGEIGGTWAAPAIVPDGAHGAYVAWRENGPEVFDIPVPTGRPVHITHLTPNGGLAPGWPSGGLVAFGGRLGYGPVNLVPDGAGGAILTSWEYDCGCVLAQRLTAGGADDPRWSAGGLTFAPSGFARGGTSASDGAGGVYVSWLTPFDAYYRTDLYVQRISGDGIIAPGWAGYPDHGMLAAPAPNPAADAVAVRFALPAAADVTLRVFDLSGAAVRTVFRSEPHSGGQHIAHWDGHDDAGRLVRPGIYVVRIEAAGFSDARRVAIVR